LCTILNIYFSIKIIKQFRGPKKFSERDRLSKNTIFKNPGGQLPPPGSI
jgi:hypothetical protein